MIRLGMKSPDAESKNFEIEEETNPLVRSTLAHSPSMPSDIDKHKKAIMKTKGKSYTVYAIVIVLVVLSYFAFTHFGSHSLDSSNLSIDNLGMDIDRAKSYNVKVLDAAMTDEQLNALPKESFSYLTMIDAGSSGCRAHVYKYGKLGSIDGPLYVLPQHVSKKVKPGLSTFAGNPQDAGKYLADLVSFIKEQVPEEDWTVTPIWLKATAGLRMLDKSVSEKILISVRAFLGSKANSPFMFRPSWASIISGQEEGGCGWIAYNYLKKVIGPKKPAEPQLPFAVVEMGGASAQVTQQAPSEKEAAKIPKEYIFRFSVGADAYTLYTHSYLGFGAEQAREQLNKRLTSPAAGYLTEKDASGVVRISDPCLQSGFARPSSTPRADVYEGPMGSYFNISGSYNSATSSCLAAIKPIFGADATKVPAETSPDQIKQRGDAASGSKQTCGENPAPYSFHCTHQPKFVAESVNFLVFENFYYTASGLDAKSVSNGGFVDGVLQTTPSNMLTAADAYCKLSWTQAVAEYPKDKQSKDTNTKMCFIGNYAYSLLVHGLGVPPSKTINIQKDVGSSEIEWALGAAYKEAAGFLKRTNLRPTR